MIVHHFKSRFRAILSKEKKKDSIHPSLYFFNTVPKEITLFEIQKISSRNFKEEQAGVYFLPLVKERGKTCAIFLQAEDKLLLESSNLRDLICFPSVGEGRLDVRHLYQTNFSKTSDAWIIWEGEAIFSYLEEEKVEPEIILEDTTEQVTTLVIPPVSSDKVLVNDSPWWQPSTGSIPRKIPTKFYQQVEETFPWGLLLIGLIFLFVNPLLGVLILFLAFFSLTQRKKGSHASQIGTNQSQAPASAQRKEGGAAAKASPQSAHGLPPVQSPKNKPNVFGFIFSIIFALPVLFFLWTFLPSLFWIFLVALMLFVFGFFSPSKNWLFISRIIFYFLLVVSLLFLLGLLIQNLNLIPDTKDESDTKPRTEQVRDSTTNELLNKHSIVWENPHFVGKDELTYYTANQNYLGSKESHATISSLSNNGSTVAYWNKVYNRLLANDNTKIDSLATLVSSVAKERNYSQLETSEYLISFIQELPYVLVHDYSCQEVINNSNDFAREYHIEGNPCLPNIIAGVHSPYEFMHTLAGDCDTRSLFGHAILTKLGISSSIWISEQYGHSILGVGVPASSDVQKSVMGIPHYGVELTAKGFRLGMIAPDQRNLNNWDIALYKNF